MNVLEKLIGQLGGNLVKETGEVIAKVGEGHTGKKELAAEIEGLISKHLGELAELATREVELREKVMVSELTQDDVLTRRMRPLLAGSGVILALLEGLFRLSLFLTDKVPVDQINTVPTLIPDIYWTGWIAAVSVWGIGRSFEKVKTGGTIGELSQFITGGRRVKRKMLDIE